MVYTKFPIMKYCYFLGPNGYHGYFTSCDACRQNCTYGGYYYPAGNGVTVYLCFCSSGFILNRDMRTCRGMAAFSYIFRNLEFCRII